MNQTIKKFLERNGIDAGNIPKEMNVTLTNPKNFNRFLDYFPVQKDKVKKYVCITDIIGSDAFKTSGSIYDLLDNLFNKRNNPLHRKNTDLLELTNETTSLIYRKGNIPLSDLPNIEISVKSLESGATLSISALLNIARFLKISREVKEYFSSNDDI